LLTILVGESPCENVPSKESQRLQPNIFAYNVQSHKHSENHPPGDDINGGANRHLKRNGKKLDLNDSFQMIKSKRVDEETETFNCMWDLTNKVIQNNGVVDDADSFDFEADFKNLKKIDSERHSEHVDSLNLGSDYDNNEYQFDDKVSSVQRDLSLANCTDEYNSILNSSDVSNDENNDRIATLKKAGGLKRNDTSAKLGSLGSGGMSRIKSSAKLFTLPNHPERSFDSESISNLSTGDSAYPVLAFEQRTVKKFEPKITINFINKKQFNIIGKGMSRVPTHTKLRYEPPLKSKYVSSPPQQ